MVQMAELLRKLHPHLAIFGLSHTEKIQQTHHGPNKELDNKQSIDDCTKPAEKILDALLGCKADPQAQT